MAKTDRTERFERLCVFRLIPLDRPLVWGGQYKHPSVELLGNQRNKPCFHGLFR